mmetsp:Transcript_14265/g.15806  ORF Transcript_14265/g.15806 Transcript_14265/m.15806 type:complete len:381 (-) Transcript_14265:38-1180(-)
MTTFLQLVFILSCLLLVGGVFNTNGFREEGVGIPVSGADACYCEGGAFGYEAIAISDGGAGCIGGCGGSPFEFHANGTTVERIDVWPKCGAHGGLRAIKVTLFNGMSKTFGQPVCSTSNSFTFKPGEYLVGDLILAGDGIGTRTGYIEFTTNLKRTFKSGEPHTLYHFPVQSGFLTGFFGRSGDDIDHLGFYVIKPIQSTSLTSMQYPTLASLETGLNPVEVAKYSFCNDESIKQSYSETFKKTVGSDHCWSVTAGLSIEDDVTVTAGVPEVESVKDEFKWTVSVSTTFSGCEHQSSETDSTVTIIGEPKHITKATFTQWASKLNLPFTAVLTLHLKDGKDFRFSTHGVYEGIYVTQVNESLDGRALKHDERCNTTMSIA